MLLHPSPNCSIRAENLVHVHFKEEIGVAELIPLVTTYIILFAYIYFSTRRSWQGGHRCSLGQTGISTLSKSECPPLVTVLGAWVGLGLLFLKKDPS
jgi:hypothetical protein